MYIVRYNGELPANLEEHFANNARRQYNNSVYKRVKVVKKKYSRSSDNYYFSGTIYFKRKIKDFDYEIRNLLEQNIQAKDTFVSDSLDFIIMRNPNIVIFFNKAEAKQLGMRIVSDILFDNVDSLNSLTFNCTEIYNNKQRENISEIKFNGARCDGNITSQGQWGERIEDDDEFLDVEDRYGIGFVWDGIQITVYESGSIRFSANTKDFDRQMEIRKRVLNKFLRFAN